MNDPIPYVADNEDGVSWFGRAGVSRHSARREYADMVGTRPWPWHYRVRPEFMRPYDQSACEAAAHGRGDDDELLDDACRCDGMVDEGWMLVCGPEHRAAIAVWRVEGYVAPAWLWRLRHRRARLYRALRGEGRPVLWGGCVERDVNRLDRLIAGRGICLRLLGARQLRFGESVWLWCDTCGGYRSHWCGPHGGRCQGRDHFERGRAAREASV